MTTFQAIIYALVHGFGVFLPISASAHALLIPYLFNCPEATGALAAALYLGLSLSVFFYFIHDWASIISGFLQVLVFRRKPMTLDERLPIFLFCTGIPLGIAEWHLRPILERIDWNPLLVAGILAVGALPLIIADSRSRKTKGMFDWNWLDALLVGIAGIFMFIPGGGMPEGFIPGALIRNFTRESAAKYSFYAMFPVLVLSTYYHFREITFHGALHGGPAPDLSWLTFVTATVVTFLSGLLAIGYVMKQVQRNGFGKYMVYRLLLAAAVGATYWMRSRG
jgi:undecaprenyl-diphosphatase